MNRNGPPIPPGGFPPVVPQGMEPYRDFGMPDRPNRERTEVHGGTRFSPGGAPVPAAPVGLGGIPPDAVPVKNSERYAFLRGSGAFPVTNAAGGTKLVEAPPDKRNFLMMRNSSAGAVNIFVEFGNIASTASTVRLAQNEMILFDAVVPQDDIYAIADGASAQLSISYSNITLGG